MSERVYNFSAGPAVLPLEVLEQVQREIVCLPGAGMSVMEMSHRSKAFSAIIEAAEENLRRLLNIPNNYRVLFLQGGALSQFYMIPMNLMKGRPADYIVTGTWSKKAMGQGKTQGTVKAIWDGSADNFNSLPCDGSLEGTPGAAFTYYTSNETIQGVQFPSEPAVHNGADLICDASSEFLYKPLDVSKYGCVYACAQKNCGPAGVTLIVMREDLIENSADGLPDMLSYKRLAAEKSMLNTPPTFAIYVVKLVLEWLLNTVGGLENMYALNKEKAAILYNIIDGSGGFYVGHAQKNCRSIMNVPFRMQSADLDAKFLADAASEGLISLAGHRSVGGFRASIYNAMPLDGVKKLAEFMLDFQKKNG